MYDQKTPQEILASLKGMVLSRTELSDVLPGSVLSTLLNAVAQEMGSAQRSLFNLREGFFLGGATGQELTERCAELPPNGVRRLSASPASGSVLRLTRDTAIGDLTIPAGSVVATQSGIQFSIPYATMIPEGAFSLSGIYCVATTQGRNTNVAVGEINTLVSVPESVISVTNTIPLGNGSDEESDDDLRQRALTYIQGVSRSQREALRYLATSFIASQGERMRYVSVYENIESPGYTEVIVDDGTGIEVDQVSRSGTPTSGLIPQGGIRILFHEAPATEPITPSSLTITRNGSVININASDVVSIPERGIVYIKNGALQEGDSWIIDNYRVFTGFISELQREIEGDPDQPSQLTGFRSAGTRVVVKPANPQFVRLDLQLQIEMGYSFDQISVSVENALLDLINSLAPSQPMFTSALIQRARQVSGVRDVLFFERGGSIPLGNTYPESPQTALRADNQSINITPLVV